MNPTQYATQLAASPFRLPLNAQAAGLEKLGDMAPSFLYQNGKLITRDVGQFAGSTSDFLSIWAKGSWRLGTPMNDIRPWKNIGANGQIYDPALHPVQQGLYWGGSAAVVGAGGTYIYYSLPGASQGGGRR